MNTTKNTLRTRAGLLFAAEERSQELMSLALLQQSGFQVLENTAGNSTTNQHSLDALLSDSSQGILNVHQQLQYARGNAAQLQAHDKQLNQLNRLIYGGNESPAVEEIIEGEIIEEVRATKGG
jgi:hypothetical protein